jgi:hypothetical protein
VQLIIAQVAQLVLLYAQAVHLTHEQGAGGTRQIVSVTKPGRDHLRSLAIRTREGVSHSFLQKRGGEVLLFLSFFFAKPLRLSRLIGEDHGPCPGRF